MLNLTTSRMSIQRWQLLTAFISLLTYLYMTRHLGHALTWNPNENQSACFPIIGEAALKKARKKFANPFVYSTLTSHWLATYYSSKKVICAERGRVALVGIVYSTPKPGRSCDKLRLSADAVISAGDCQRIWASQFLDAFSWKTPHTNKLNQFQMNGTEQCELIAFMHICVRDINTMDMCAPASNFFRDHLTNVKLLFNDASRQGASQCTCSLQSSTNQSTVDVRALDVRLHTENVLYLDDHELRHRTYWWNDSFGKRGLTTISLQNLTSRQLPKRVWLKVHGENVTITCGLNTSGTPEPSTTTVTLTTQNTTERPRMETDISAFHGLTVGEVTAIAAASMLAGALLTAFLARVLHGKKHSHNANDNNYYLTPVDRPNLPNVIPHSFQVTSRNRGHTDRINNHYANANQATSPPRNHNNAGYTSSHYMNTTQAGSSSSSRREEIDPRSFYEDVDNSGSGSSGYLRPINNGNYARNDPDLDSMGYSQPTGFSARQHPRAVNEESVSYSTLTPDDPNYINLDRDRHLYHKADAVRGHKSK